MKINCIWEHNGDDSVIYSTEYIGAYARGESREAALAKMPAEIISYCNWLDLSAPDEINYVISQDKASDLNIKDADSDVIFDSETGKLSEDEYLRLKALALKSAKDFLRLYNSIPDKDNSCMPFRRTFYGSVPRTAREMYEHTKNVNAYYFGEIGVDADNEGSIIECRRRGFEMLEQKPDFLENTVFEGSYGEQWSLRKLLRRFIWHDRIHAKAMYRMAQKTFSQTEIINVFGFNT